MVQLSLGLLATCVLSGHLALGGVIQPAPRSAQVCYDGEDAALLCYHDTSSGSVPQNVDVTDVSYIGAYLRRYGRQNPRKPAFFTMLAADTAGCAEWTLYTHGSALALAKHLNPSVNPSVLFEDIAATIDGGDKATDAQKQAAIIGCLSDGGSLGVLINGTNPAYAAAEYVASGYQPGGILVKIVHSAVSTDS